MNLDLEPIIFLDRDGTLNELVYHQTYDEYGPPWEPEDVVLKLGVVPALNLLMSAGYKLVVVTNQPDAAKDKTSLQQIELVKEGFVSLLEQKNIKISGYYHCVHHQNGVVPSLTCNCTCRKPGVGMLLAYAETISLDKSRSWIIGDSISDIQTGVAFGIKTIGLPSCDPQKSTLDCNADANFENITQAVEFILEN